jgi:hypothetical protein
MFLNKPSYNTFTSFFAVVIPTGIQSKHQNKRFRAVSVSLVPQWINQTKDVTKINLSMFENLIKTWNDCRYYNTPRGALGVLVDGLWSVL